jgi:hypothetical protein
MKPFLIIVVILIAIVLVSMVFRRLRSSTPQNTEALPPSSGSTTIDPSKILFSMPTN